LEKKGDIGLIKSWRKRYFVLREDKCVYYKDQSMRDAECVIGFIPLGDVQAVRPTGTVTGGFQIDTTDRIWYLRAESSLEMDKWISAIKAHSGFEEKHRSAFVMRRDLPNITGNLDKMHARNLQQRARSLTLSHTEKIWKARWVRLNEGILYVYKAQEDPKKPTKFPLYKCVVETAEPSDPECTCFKLITSTKNAIFRAESVESMIKWINAIQLHRLVIESIIGTGANAHRSLQNIGHGSFRVETPTPPDSPSL